MDMRRIREMVNRRINPALKSPGYLPVIGRRWEGRGHHCSHSLILDLDSEVIISMILLKTCSLGEHIFIRVRFWFNSWYHK